MKRKIANITTVVAYGALLASVVLGIIMLVNFYKWRYFEIGDYIIQTEEIGRLLQQRNEYHTTALSLIEPVCYTLFSGFALLMSALILKLEAKQIQVK